MMTKYDVFFDEIKKFMIMVGWADNNSFLGAPDNQIKQFELENNVRIGLGYRSYLKCFGNKIKYSYMDPIGLYNFPKIEEVTLIEKEYNEDFIEEGVDDRKNWVKTISNQISTNNEYQNAFGTGKPILIGHYIESDYIFFTMENKKEFRVNSLEDWGKYKLTTGMLITSLFRNAFWMKWNFWLKSNGGQIKKSDSSFDQSYNEMIKSISTYNLKKIPWLKFYYSMVKKGGTFSQNPRTQFNKIMEERELKENRFFGVDEFEIEYIKFLIEEKIVKPMPHIFNPYEKPLTFHQYFSSVSDSSC